MGVDPAAVERSYVEVRHRIDALGGEAVRIVAITKGFGPDAIDAVVRAGCTDVGESYAQEAVPKLEAVEQLSLPPHTVHFIGRLQTNKVRALVGHVHRWDSVDRPSVVAELARRAPGARVLVQVNTTDEPSKAGIAPEGAPGLVDLAGSAGLEVLGLLTIGPTDGSNESVRRSFAALRSLVDRLGLTVCSMGMSDDLEIAVAEGATEVRVGSRLFGTRPTRETGAVA